MLLKNNLMISNYSGLSFSLCALSGGTFKIFFIQIIHKRADPLENGRNRMIPLK